MPITIAGITCETWSEVIERLREKRAAGEPMHFTEAEVRRAIVEEQAQRVRSLGPCAFTGEGTFKISREEWEQLVNAIEHQHLAKGGTIIDDPPSPELRHAQELARYVERQGQARPLDDIFIAEDLRKHLREAATPRAMNRKERRAQAAQQRRKS